MGLLTRFLTAPQGGNRPRATGRLGLGVVGQIGHASLKGGHPVEHLPVRSTGPEMDRHYRNVGCVAVAMAQLEETAAVIVYAARGGWDSTYEHLKLMAVSRKLWDELDKVRDGLSTEAETRRLDPESGAVRVEKGELRRRVEAFVRGSEGVAEERHKIVHSVLVQYPWDPEILAVHAKSIRAGHPDASRPLPSDAEIATLVDRIDGLIRDGHRLAPYIAGAMETARANGDSSTGTAPPPAG